MFRAVRSKRPPRQTQGTRSSESQALAVKELFDERTFAFVRPPLPAAQSANQPPIDTSRVAVQGKFDNGFDVHPCPGLNLHFVSSRENPSSTIQALFHSTYRLYQRPSGDGLWSGDLGFLGLRPDLEVHAMRTSARRGLFALPWPTPLHCAPLLGASRAANVTPRLNWPGAGGRRAVPMRCHGDPFPCVRQNPTRTSVNARLPSTCPRC